MGLTSLMTNELVMEPKGSTLLILRPTTLRGPETQFTAIVRVCTSPQ